MPLIDPLEGKVIYDRLGHLAADAVTRASWCSTWHGYGARDRRLGEYLPPTRLDTTPGRLARLAYDHGYNP